MDYAAYKEYQKTIPDSIIRLDDVSPYELLAVMGQSNNTYNVAFAGDYILYGRGVRNILQTLFARFYEQQCSFIIPNDIYPVYFDLVPEDSLVSVYQTFQQQRVNLPNQDNVVVLVANPFVPEGKYLNRSQLSQFDEWLRAGENRWLIIDGVYDLLNLNGNYLFNSKHVILLGSLSKIALQPGKMGWAICNTRLNGFKYLRENVTTQTYAEALSKLYSDAWNELSELLVSVDKNWQSPEVGYISVVNHPHKKLLQHNIAALPASVFGIKSDEYSVVSCLVKIKDELL